MGTPSGANSAAAVMSVNQQRQFIIDSFRGQIIISDQMDVQDTPIYDTVTYAAGATINTPNSQFFTNVGSSSGKSFVQTNMTQTQKLTAPEAFSVFGVRFYWDSTILRADLNLLLQNFVNEFWMLTKNYQRAPIYHFSAGMGIDGFSSRTNDSVYTNGTVNRDSMHLLQIPLVISNQLSFYGQLIGPISGNSSTLSSSGNGAILVTELVGLYARGVL
jgi:hypothetical protein